MLVTDFIQKLSEKGKFIGAVKFAYAFGLVDRFPPVPFLKEHVKDSLKMAEEVRKKGNNSSQAQVQNPLHLLVTKLTS